MPAVVPSVHCPAVATPSVPVAALVVLIVPLAAPTLKLTVTFGTGWPSLDVTRTEGAGLTVLPTTAVIVVDVWAVTLAGVSCWGPEVLSRPPQPMAARTATPRTSRADRVIESMGVGGR